MQKAKICIISNNTLSSQALKEVLTKKDFEAYSVKAGSLVDNHHNGAKFPNVIVWEESVIRSKGKIVFDLYEHIGGAFPSVFILSSETVPFLGLGLTEGVRGFVHIDGGVKELEQCLNIVLDDAVFISPFFSGTQEINGQRKAQSNKNDVNLTSQETKILHFIHHKKTSKQIGQILNISYKTVQNHRQNMCNKLGLRGRDKLYEFAKVYCK